MVETAMKEIERHWPDHAGHKSGTRHARWSTAEGVVCACGDVLGWPDPDNHETLSQYAKRIAKERVDAASASGRIKGAFGSYVHRDPEDGERPVVSGPEYTPEPGDYPDPEVQEPEGLPAGDGRKAYDDLPYDVPEEDGPTNDPWADTPNDEPEPEPVEIEDPHVKAVAARVDEIVEEPADYVDPAIAQARRATGVHAVTDVALPGPWADEAQTESDFPPWSEVDDRIPSNEGIPAEAEPGTELATVSEIGRDPVPYAGTPIFPEIGDELDPLNGRLAPLDPTEPYTPQDVELKIVEILGQLEKSEIFLRQQVAREHQATHNHSLRYALAIAKSNARAQDQRQAEATLATEQELREMNEAKALTKCLRDSQHNLRSQLSGFQSVARSLGVSLTNALDGRSMPSSSVPPEPPRAPWER